MKRLWLPLLLALLVGPCVVFADDAVNQILVTFESKDGGYQASSFQPPYRVRKRYPVSASIRKAAKAIAEQYALKELERWPLKSLSVYCFVYEVDADDVEFVVAALAKDRRVESAQVLNQFETQADDPVLYDDEYLPMQHSLGMTDVLGAHRVSRGNGVRVAVVDSDADHRHEDLRGAMKRTRHVSQSGRDRDRIHGTAVASIIGARANNAMGIVGVAPGATLEVAEACWRDDTHSKAICDTFSLAKALDAMTDSPPQVINMSLAGPDDALLRRIIDDLINRGAVVVAAQPNAGTSALSFPASMPAVIPVATMGTNRPDGDDQTIYAPGEHILVAVPSDNYAFQSGSSLAAAHVTGIVALLKASSASLDSEAIRNLLIQSQSSSGQRDTAVNACEALRLSNPDMVRNCSER